MTSLLLPLLRIVGLLLLGYAVLCLYLYWRQDALLFLPEQAPLETVQREAQAVGFRLWPETGENYRALLAEPLEAAIGTCLIWHGNAGSARHRDYLAAPLLSLGWRVVVAEYPGYGGRPDGNRRETALVAEAEVLLLEVRQRFGGKLVVIGESLGAAIAAAAAGRQPAAVTGVVLLTPWSDLAGVARYHYPWLPVPLLLRDRFDNTAALQAYRGPVLIVTAADDEVIPAVQGERLHAGLGSLPRRLRTIPRAHHNDWSERVSVADWQAWLAFAAGG